MVTVEAVALVVLVVTALTVAAGWEGRRFWLWLWCWVAVTVAVVTVAVVVVVAVVAVVAVVVVVSGGGSGNSIAAGGSSGSLYTVDRWHTAVAPLCLMSAGYEYSVRSINWAATDVLHAQLEPPCGEADPTNRGYNIATRNY